MPIEHAAVTLSASASGADVNGVARLLIRFSEAVDSRRPADVAALFAADGLFKPAEKAIIGRSAIEAFYRQRLSDPRRTTRHLWSNLLVTPEADGAARIQVILSNYAFEPAIMQTEVRLRVGMVTGRCVGARGDWVFAEHLYERSYALRLPVDEAIAPVAVGARS
ncbi:MAG TPA: nuclear transport factor 2 family protein [Caulobacteraceae bacterium]|jgi:hypothetical protein|nr:nuclear transport factor 2 family protein [Caulobacteraceae bacterium]